MPARLFLLQCVINRKRLMMVNASTERYLEPECLHGSIWFQEKLGG